MPTPDVRVRLSAEGVAEVVAALKQIQGESQKTQQTQGKGFGALNSVLSSTKKLLGAVGIGFGALQAVRLGGQAISELKQWESSWAEVRTIMSATRGESEALSRSVRELASVIPQDQSLLARGYYQALSSGINDTRQALDFTRTAAKAATGGLTDVFTSVDVGTTILNAYNKNANEAGHIFDVLFTTVREGKVEFADLAGSIGTAIPTYAQAKIPFEQLAAALATLSKGGMNAEMSTTALRSMLMQVMKPADESRAYAEQLGLAFDTEAVAAKGLVPWLKEIQEKTKGNSRAIAKLFPDVRGLNAVLALSGAQWEEFARIMDVTTNQSMGASQEAFDKITETAAAQEQLLRNRLKNAWIDLGQGILRGWGSILAGIGAMLPETFEMQSQAMERTQRQIQAINTRGQQLVRVYQQVSRESDGSEAAQKRMRQAMLDLATAFPEVITQFDQYGNVVAINTGKLNDRADALKRVLDLQARDTFLEQASRVEKLNRQIAQTSQQLNELAARPSTDLVPAEERLVAPLEFWGASHPAGRSGPVQSVEQAFNTMTAGLDEKKAELAARIADMAKILVTSGLDAEVEAFDALAQEIEDGKKPAEALGEALDNLTPSLRVILGTLDPAAMATKMREFAKYLREAKTAATQGGTGNGEAKEKTFEEQLAEARATAAFQASARDREIAQIKKNAQDSLATEQAALKNSEKSVAASYATRREIITQAFNAEIALLEKKLAIASQEKDANKNATETARLSGEIAARRVEYETQMAELGRDERDAQEAADEQVLQTERRIMELRGQRYEAELAQIEGLARARNEELVVAGVDDAQREQRVADYRELLTMQANFSELSRQADRKKGDIESAIAAIQRDMSAGLVDEAEGHQRILELTEARIPPLEALADQMVAIATVIGDPELAQEAKELRDAINGIGSNAANVGDLAQKVDDLGRNINLATFDALSDAIAGIGEETKTAEATFDAFAKSVLQQLKQLIAQWLVFRGLSAIGMKFNEGGSVAGKKASGGQVFGPGTSTSDSIPAWLSAGEFVIRARHVQRPGGLAFLTAYNAGQLDPQVIMKHWPALASGGTPRLISPRAFASGGYVAPEGGEMATPANGRMEVYLADGLAARILDSPAGEKWLLKSLARNRRAFGKLFRG